MLTLIIAAVVVSASLITLIAPVLPLVVDAVTDSHFATPRLKSLLLVVLVAAATFLDTAVINDDVATFSNEALATLVLNLVVAFAAFFGILKPTGASDAVQRKTRAVAVLGKPKP